jgi:Grx4 family monothiol glutaredoxin
VVAFIKGTRSQPQCGFSHKLLTILNDSRADYEVVNVLDEFYNPGLREAIKSYSMWPTIPQLYVGGEFVGGSDIVEEMQGNGQLAQLLPSAAEQAAGSSGGGSGAAAAAAPAAAGSNAGA